MFTKRRIIYIFSVLLVALSGLGAVILWMQIANQPLPAQAAKLDVPTTVVFQGLPTPALLPGSTLLPQPTVYPPASWNAAPDCASQPASIESLSIASAASASDYRRALWLSPTLAGLKPSEFNALLGGQNAETTAYTKRTLIGLAVNVATGRVNRASRVNFPGLPEVKTVGALLSRLEDGVSQGSAAPEILKAAQQLQAGQAITQAVCAHLLATQAGGHAADIQWSGNRIQAQAVSNVLPGTQPSGMDTVTVSPDGRWAAFTSTGNDSGGPVFLLELASGTWANLIERINDAAPANQAKLAPDANWDVIGWMPDSRRLVIGASDASVVLLVDIHSGQLVAIPFEGGGVGGEMAVGLAPDGSQFAFVGLSPSGDGQSLSLYHLDSGQVTPLLSLPYTQGSLYFPRFSPDGKTLVYITQKGQPDQGQSESIALVNLETRSVTILMEGELGLSLPAWSPDGRYLAFVRRDPGEPNPSTGAQPLYEPMQNVWVIDFTSGMTQQVTFVHGQALKPHWAPDARTLSFVTHDGQVGLVRVDAPGKIWRADPTNPDPRFSNSAFVP